jgi:hypothetical protein
VPLSFGLQNRKEANVADINATITFISEATGKELRRSSNGDAALSFTRQPRFLKFLYFFFPPFFSFFLAFFLAWSFLPFFSFFLAFFLSLSFFSFFFATVSTSFLIDFNQGLLYDVANGDTVFGLVVPLLPDDTVKLNSKHLSDVNRHFA